MSTVRTRKNKNYTTINNTVLNDVALTWKAKGLAAYLLSKPDDWKVRREHLAKQSEDGISAVRSALQELERFGYLVRQKTRTVNGIIEWEYILHEEPQNREPLQEKQGVRKKKGVKPVDENQPMVPPADNPPVENPPVENPPVENPPVENQPLLLSTDVPSTDVPSTDSPMHHHGILPPPPMLVTPNGGGGLPPHANGERLSADSGKLLANSQQPTANSQHNGNHNGRHAVTNDSGALRSPQSLSARTLATEWAADFAAGWASLETDLAGWTDSQIRCLLTWLYVWAIEADSQDRNLEPAARYDAGQRLATNYANVYAGSTNRIGLIKSKVAAGVAVPLTEADTAALEGLIEQP